MDRDELIATYLKIADHYSLKSDMSRYNLQYIEIAKLHEQDEEYIEALKILNKCIEEKTNYDKVLEKRSTIQMKLEKFADASKTFESMAERQLKKTLGAFSARKHICMSILCALVFDVVLAKNKFDHFTNTDHTFESSKEGTLVSQVLEAIYKNDVDGFEYACADFDRIVNLTPEQVLLLTKTKHSLTGETAEVADDIDIS